MEEVTKQKWKPFIKLFFRTKVTWHWYILGLIVSFGVTTIGLGFPLVLSRIIEGEIFDSKLVLSYLGLLLAMALGSTINGIIYLFGNTQTTRNLQISIWDKFISVPMSFFSKGKPSQFVSRITSDSTFANQAVSSTFDLLSGGYAIVGATVIMYNMDTELTFALLPLIPYIIIVTIVVGHFRHKAQYRIQGRYSDITAFFAERLSNIRLIKSFGTENKEERTASKVIDNQYKADFYSAKVGLFSGPFQESIYVLPSAIVLIYGGIKVASGTLDAGDLVAFWLYVQTYPMYIMEYARYYTNIKQIQGASQKVAELLETPSENLRRKESLLETNGSGNANIVFDHVSFKYDEKQVIYDANFTIPEGKITAIVGPSGSGKTTLFSLIERIYVPDTGTIRLGTKPVENIHLDEWRSAFGYVSQNSPLLSGTIRENIIYGMKRDVSEQELRLAAQQANALEFIEAFTDGFDTEVGEGGSKLSGGQRQRIAIARAIIMDPKFLLLDEAVSSLDGQSAKVVQDALETIMVGRTSVVITHKLSTIKRVDQIIVFDRGRVVGIGTHDELFENNDFYRESVMKQEENNKSIISA